MMERQPLKYSNSCLMVFFPLHRMKSLGLSIPGVFWVQRKKKSRGALRGKKIKSNWREEKEDGSSEKQGNLVSSHKLVREWQISRMQLTAIISCPACSQRLKTEKSIPGIGSRHLHKKIRVEELHFSHLKWGNSPLRASIGWCMQCVGKGWWIRTLSVFFLDPCVKSNIWIFADEPMWWHNRYLES